ncbi:MAG: DUF6364 family protein [Balneolaceae bacterium]
MKKKLTLTIEEEIIATAKQYAKRRGISVSQMFEEAVGKGDSGKIETESQRAAKRLLNTLQNAESTESKDDKQLNREHVKRKYA